jgi:hypothetical protein
VDIGGNAVYRDPGSCGGVPNGLGDSFAGSPIEAPFGPLLIPEAATGPGGAQI